MIRLIRPLAAIGLAFLFGTQASAQFVLNGYMMGVAEQPRFRSEFSLVPDQVERLKGATAAARRDMAAASKSFSEVKGPEAAKVLGAKRKAIADAYAKELAAVLKPQELKRLRQISLRMQGGGGLAFRDQAVRDELKLSGEQTVEVDEILDAATKRMGEISRKMNNPQTRDEGTRAANRLNADLLASLMEVLDEGQKAKWAEMLGAPIR